MLLLGTVGRSFLWGIMGIYSCIGCKGIVGMKVSNSKLKNGWRIMICHGWIILCGRNGKVKMVIVSFRVQLLIVFDWKVVRIKIVVLKYSCLMFRSSTNLQIPRMINLCSIPRIFWNKLRWSIRILMVFRRSLIIIVMPSRIAPGMLTILNKLKVRKRMSKYLKIFLNLFSLKILWIR